MASKRSKAAKKGWATRRAKELQRRLAALKGWQTRKKGKTPSKSSPKPSAKGSKKSPKSETISKAEKALAKQIVGNIVEKVFARRVRFFPEARRRALRIGTRLMGIDMLLMASSMTKSEMRAAAANKAYENEDGYNPFWYHG